MTILLLAPKRVVGQARGESKLDRIEWFIEGGESFLNLGRQTATFPSMCHSGVVSTGCEATIALPGGYSGPSNPPVLTGPQFRLTARDSIQFAYSDTINRFTVQPVVGDLVQTTGYTFARGPALTVNYVRNLGSLAGWRPFVLGGAGAVRTTSAVTGHGRWEPSYDFGFGADHKITGGIAFRVEVRDFVERLPSPLHGYSNNISPMFGVVFNSRPPQEGANGPSRIEVFAEAGGSFLTGDSVQARVGLCTVSCTLGSVVMQHSYSKTGRYTAGLRVYVSPKNAVQFDYSFAPNRSQSQVCVIEPIHFTLPPTQESKGIEDFVFAYVRNLRGQGLVRPFAEGGGGWTFFIGRKWEHCLAFGGGVDFRLERQLALRIELRDLLSPQPFPSIRPTNGWTHNLVPMAGLALRFK